MYTISLNSNSAVKKVAIYSLVGVGVIAFIAMAIILNVLFSQYHQVKAQISEKTLSSNAQVSPKFSGGSCSFVDNATYDGNGGHYPTCYPATFDGNQQADPGQMLFCSINCHLGNDGRQHCSSTQASFSEGECGATCADGKSTGSAPQCGNPYSCNVTNKINITASCSNINDNSNSPVSINYHIRGNVNKDGTTSKNGGVNTETGLTAGGYSYICDSYIDDSSGKTLTADNSSGNFSMPGSNGSTINCHYTGCGVPTTTIITTTPSTPTPTPTPTPAPGQYQFQVTALCKENNATINTSYGISCTGSGCGVISGYSTSPSTLVAHEGTYSTTFASSASFQGNNVTLDHYENGNSATVGVGAPDNYKTIKAIYRGCTPATITTTQTPSPTPTPTTPPVTTTPIAQCTKILLGSGENNTSGNLTAGAYVNKSDLFTVGPVVVNPVNGKLPNYHWFYKFNSGSANYKDWTDYTKLVSSSFNKPYITSTLSYTPDGTNAVYYVLGEFNPATNDYNAGFGVNGADCYTYVRLALPTPTPSTPPVTTTATTPPVTTTATTPPVTTTATTPPVTTPPCLTVTPTTEVTTTVPMTSPCITPTTTPSPTPTPSTTPPCVTTTPSTTPNPSTTPLGTVTPTGTGTPCVTPCLTITVISITATISPSPTSNPCVGYILGATTTPIVPTPGLAKTGQSTTLISILFGVAVVVIVLVLQGTSAYKKNSNELAYLSNSQLDADLSIHKIAQQKANQEKYNAALVSIAPISIQTVNTFKEDRDASLRNITEIINRNFIN